MDSGSHLFSSQHISFHCYGSPVMVTVRNRHGCRRTDGCCRVLHRHGKPCQLQKLPVVLAIPNRSGFRQRQPQIPAQKLQSCSLIHILSGDLQISGSGHRQGNGKGADPLQHSAACLRPSAQPVLRFSLSWREKQCDLSTSNGLSR